MPPFYFTLTSRLSGRGEWGEVLTPTQAKDGAFAIRNFMLNISQEKEDSAVAWKRFIETHKEDKAAQFVAEVL